LALEDEGTAFPQEAGDLMQLYNKKNRILNYTTVKASKLT